MSTKALLNNQESAAPRERDGYFRKARSSLRRPRLRGAMMAKLLPIWPVAAALHLFLVQLLLESSLGVRSGLRAIVAVATSSNVLFSSRYHNSDLRTRGQPTPERLVYETFYLRWDFVGISLVLSFDSMLFHTGSACSGLRSK